MIPSDKKPFDDEFLNPARLAALIFKQAANERTAEIRLELTPGGQADAKAGKTAVEGTSPSLRVLYHVEGKIYEYPRAPERLAADAMAEVKRLIGFEAAEDLPQARGGVVIDALGSRFRGGAVAWRNSGVETLIFYIENRDVD